MRRPEALARAAAVFRGRHRTYIASVAVLLSIGGALAGWSWHKHHSEALFIGPTVGRIDRVASGRPTRVITFAEGCMNARCHTSMGESRAVHAPVASGVCDVCHAPDSGGHRYPLVRPKADICSGCHDTGERHLVQHKAMTADGCLACHSAHGGPTPALLVEASTAATCAHCHPGGEGIVKHAPNTSDQCDVCHAPHGSDGKGLLLAGDALENCRVCHARTVHEVETASHAHKNVERSCLACHSPHTSATKGLLAASPGEMCVTCHADVGSAIAGAIVSHDPVLKGEQCIRCHDPHASEQIAMLRDTQASVCLSCHNKPVTAAAGRTILAMSPPTADPLSHGGVHQGECSGCHSVHGGSHAELLREVNDRVPLGPFDASNYALCFSCHDSRLAQSASATQFRDGERNLHELHLKSGDRSRGCATCHSVHNGDRPRLISATVNFEGSAWAMPMGFAITPDGGRCGSGCHEPLEYSRRPGGIRAWKNGGAP